MSLRGHCKQGEKTQTHLCRKMRVKISHPSSAVSVLESREQWRRLVGDMILNEVIAPGTG